MLSFFWILFICLSAPAVAICPPDTLIPLLQTGGLTFTQETVQMQGIDRIHLALSGDRGTILYHLLAEGRILQVDLIEVPSQYRGFKYSNLLISEALRRSGAQVQEIHADLRWSNYDTFKAAFDALPAAQRKLHAEEASKIAARNTPFFKSFAHLGFTEIDDASPFDVSFEVGPDTITEHGVSIILLKKPR